MMFNEIGPQKCTVWLMYIFFDAITHVSLTDDYFFTTNGHKFTRIDASFHLRIASSTFLRGDEYSSSRRNVLITAEKYSHHRGEASYSLYAIEIVDSMR